MKKVLIFCSKVLISMIFISCEGIDTGDFDDAKINFPNENNGLHWSDASSEFVLWDDAIVYCEELGGRVPTILELRTLIQNCPATEIGGECEIPESCFSIETCSNESCNGCECREFSASQYSVFGTEGYLWSRSELSEDLVWIVGFACGSVGFYPKSSDFINVRCVRY